MKQKRHINSLSNGLGAQSMLLFLMMCRREIPAEVSITSDTGWEKDRTWSNGMKTPIKVYFDEVVLPLAKHFQIEAKFVRSVDILKKELPALIDHVRWCAETGKFNNLKIPMFGSKGGRMGQVCTDKWKIRAINQTLRGMGATTACTAQGIHSSEAIRRVKGIYLRNEGPWSIYQTTVKTSVKLANGKKEKIEKPIKWLTHYYPLVDLGFNRHICQIKIVSEKIPYLLSSECDGCPHKDLTRWERTSPEVLDELSKLESLFNGEFFFTDKRIPLLEAIEAMKKERAINPERHKSEADFGCGNAICGV